MKLFKRQIQGEKEITISPYTNARKAWNDTTKAIKASRETWQILGILSLLVCLSAVGGLVHLQSQSTFVPYVVEVDKLGQQQAVAPASKAKKVDTRVVRSNLASWVTDIRTVTPDITIQRNAVFRVYSFLSMSDPATQKVNEWLNGSEESNPFSRAEEITVSIDIDSVIAQSADTWQVDWIETERDRSGAITKDPFRMRALISVYIKSPDASTTEEELRKNPLGLFINDFNWTVQI